MRKDFKELSTDPHRHTYREAADFLNRDRGFIQQIVAAPWLFVEHEHEHYENMCDKLGYYYSQFNRYIHIAGKSAYFVIAGHVGRYIDLLLEYRIEGIVSRRPEHHTYYSFSSSKIILCGRGPLSDWHCSDLLVYILDGPKQNKHYQFISPDPQLTVDLFVAFLKQPIGTTMQVEVLARKD